MDKAQLIAQAERAPYGLFPWSQFVAHTEFLWQDTVLVVDAAAWQRQWFELEIINGLALAEWEEQGRPEDFCARWREGYQQEALERVNELLGLTAEIGMLPSLSRPPCR
ncbi:hypothetical protein [Pseudomonas canadensis]|uniref:hypothetical protein n=1 Tax=Pseudomonas canadensis TaxID=915099 RepID=UPI001F388F6E|nr:hypothetical protein [Pseudomonas canadensis]MCF5173322.1 hypothetical protein [Pseudomonas canadensis]